MDVIFTYAFLSGLVLAAPMGPVFAATIRHGLKNGFPAALSVQLGSLLGDMAYACSGLVAAGYLSQFPMIGRSLNVIGAAVMFWLAFNSLQNVVSPRFPSDKSRGNAGAFATGALLSFSNVDNLLYWAGIGGVIEALIDGVSTTAGYLIFLSGFLLASVIWAFATASLITAGIKRLDPVWLRVVHLFCALMLGSLGCILVWQTI